MREGEELASAFVELEDVVRQTSRLPGFAAAQAEARRRRGNRVAWISGTLVMLVLAGAGLLIPGWLQRDRPPVLQPSPSVTAEPTPSSSPTLTVKPANVFASMTPPAHIRDAALEVPAVDVAGCPSGRLQFQDRSFVSEEGSVLLEYAAVGDIDADGVEDIVVSLRCGDPHGEIEVQVLAYSGPELMLLGRIPNWDMVRVESLLVDRGGVVQLGMAQPPGIQAIVTGRYRWTGTEFEGIETVPVPAEKLPRVTVSAEPGSLQLVPGGPAATVVVTIRNDGPTAALLVQLVLAGAEPLTIDVQGFASSHTEPRHDLLIASPRAGESVQVSMLVSLPPGAVLPAGTSVVAAVSEITQDGWSMNSATVAVVSA